MHTDEIQDQGFAIIPDVFAPTEIAQIIDSLAQTKVLRSRAGIRHLLADPQVKAFAHDERLIEIASTVLGSPLPHFAQLSSTNHLMPIGKSPGIRTQPCR